MSRVRGALFGPEVKRRLLFGALALSDGYYDKYYGKALKVRRLIADQLETVLNDVELLLLPAAAGVASAANDGASGSATRTLGTASTTTAAATSAAVAAINQVMATL